MYPIIAISIPITIAYLIHRITLSMLKNSVKMSMYSLSDVYDVRKKQRTMLGDLASDYFNSISLDGHRALGELDKILLQVEEVINYSQLAIDSSSRGFLKEAKRRMKKFHKEMEDSINTVTDTLSESHAKRLKATWEFKAQELIDIVSQQISNSSSKCKQLGYKVPTARNVRKPTDLALHEIKNLMPVD